MANYRKNKLISKSFKALILISLISFNSCEKDSIIKRPDEVITGDWKLNTEKTITRDGDTLLSISNNLDCATDDLYSFLEKEKLYIKDLNNQCSINTNIYEYRYIIRKNFNNNENYELIIFEGVGHKYIENGIGGEIINYSETLFTIKSVFGCGDSIMPAWCYRIREFIKAE
ncbi:MAG: hypothetical protein MI922_08870 [Bacteroidales bacterium]|nr:hypothetical protein [Bacteroidales bacterium]